MRTAERIIHARARRGPTAARERRELAAREYGEQHGYEGRVGGWIYKHNEPVVQGWSNFARMYRERIERWFLTRLTACDNVADLAGPVGAQYRPTCLVDGVGGWRYAYIADIFDRFVEARGESRRAYRGDGQDVRPTDDDFARARRRFAERAAVVRRERAG